MMAIVKQTQTCKVCPAKWELLTNDNKYVNVHYRWGIINMHKRVI